MTNASEIAKHLQFKPDNELNFQISCKDGMKPTGIHKSAMACTQ